MEDAIQPRFHLGFLRSEDRIPGYDLRIFSEGERICVADSPEHAAMILRALNGQGASPPMRIPAHADSHDLAEGAIKPVEGK